MKLVIKDSLIIATHQNNQDIKDLYPDSEIIWISDKIKLQNLSNNTQEQVDISQDFLMPEIEEESDPRLKWSLDENKLNAKLVIEDIAEECRSKILSNMPGKIAGYQSKLAIANRIIENKTPDPNDIAALQLEADNRGIKVNELAQIIIKKNDEFSAITTHIDGEIQKTINSVANAKSYKTVWKLLKDFEDNINKRISD